MNQRADAEISWFSALCDDDYRFLGVEDPSLNASWPHCRDIALVAIQQVSVTAGHELASVMMGVFLRIVSVDWIFD